MKKATVIVLEDESNILDIHLVDRVGNFKVIWDSYGNDGINASSRNDKIEKVVLKCRESGYEVPFQISCGVRWYDIHWLDVRTVKRFPQYLSYAYTGALL